MSFIRLERSQGEPVQVGGRTVTPESEALVIDWGQDGFVWNRPIAVTVEHNGRTERHPIINVTGIIQLVLWTTVATTIIFYLWRQSHDRA